MFGVPYVNAYNPQSSIDRINSQISELEKMREQISHQPIQTPTNLTQNFQIAPNTNSAIRYANSIDEVQKDFVIGDTPFFSKDMSIVWIKNTKGDIKTYELNEIIEKDGKHINPLSFVPKQPRQLTGKRLAQFNHFKHSLNLRIAKLNHLR